MAYSDFNLAQLQSQFHLTISQALLFKEIKAFSPPNWLPVLLDKAMPLALSSEKARSEFIIAPILLSLKDDHPDIGIYSGQRLDSDISQGLLGECDFIISASQSLALIQKPIISIVEAKKSDIESGLGQCAAQMLGAQHLNLRQQNSHDVVYGCVTTGEVWQFLKLQKQSLLIDSERYYINELGLILAVLQQILAEFDRLY
ncbi:MAG: hypothetical protein R2880_00400 [Deinococcales bacterium]